MSSGTNVTPRCSWTRLGRLGEQQLRGGPPQPVARLAHRGQRDGGGAGELDVVVADDRHSPGRRTPAHVICCSSPSARRSLAQNTAVGRRRVGQSDQPLAGPPPSATSSASVSSTTSHPSSRPPHRAARSLAAGPRPAAVDMRPADEGDALVALLEQVRRPPARRPRCRRRATLHQAPRCRPGGRRARPAMPCAGSVRAAGSRSRRAVIEHAAHPLLQEQVEVVGPRAPDRRRCCRGTARGLPLGDLLDAPRATSVKNGLRRVEHDVGDRPCCCPAGAGGADSLRTKPSRAISAWTRRRVSSRTISGRLRTFETVPTETPALARPP